MIKYNFKLFIYNKFGSCNYLFNCQSVCPSYKCLIIYYTIVTVPIYYSINTHAHFKNYNKQFWFPPFFVYRGGLGTTVVCHSFIHSFCLFFNWGEQKRAPLRRESVCLFVCTGIGSSNYY